MDSYPVEAPAMANPYALAAKKPGKSVNEMRKLFEDHNPLKNINNPFDSTDSMVDPDPSTASNPWAPTDSSFTTANAVGSGAELSSLATTDDVSAPLADEVKLFIPSDGGGGDGGLFALGRRRIVQAKKRELSTNDKLERNSPPPAIGSI